MRHIASAAVAACLLAWAAPAGADDFTRAPSIAVDADAQPVAAATGDFDSDGRQDLAIADTYGNRVYLRLGNGDGSFSDGGVIVNLERARSIAVGDFNADGTEDLAVAANLGPTKTDDVAVLLGIGNGGFTQYTTFDLGEGPTSLAVGDFNGDAKVDIAGAGYASVNVKLGNGNGTFAGGTVVAFSPSPRSVATGDFDGNGTEDLAVIANAPTARLTVLPGTGNGTFDSDKTVPLPNGGRELAVGDFNADGREDVAATIGNENRVSVRLGNGDGTLSDDLPDVAVGDDPHGIAVGDFDSDGREDLVTTNRASDRLSVRLGNGDGTFRAGGDVPVAYDGYAVAIGDFNADGKEDLAIPERQSGTMSVRLGAGQAPLDGNLLVNGGFEQGLAARLPSQSPAIPGWTTGGMTFVRYGAVPHLAFPSQLDAPRYATGGLNFLWGGEGPAGTTSARQTVDVSGSAEAIDAGRATVGLSAYLGGALAYPDSMRATAQFLSAAGASLGALTIGPVTHDDRANVSTMLRRAGNAPVPAGTRRIGVTLTAVDAVGKSLATADNVKLTLDTRPPARASAATPSRPRRPAFGAGTKVTVRLAGARIGANGPVAVRVSNANAFAVYGTVTGRVARAKLAAKGFTVAARGRRTVKLALSKKLRRELRRKGRLVVRLTLAVQDPAGNRRTLSAQVVPRLKKTSAPGNRRRR
jgi:FG-GAP-like repeat